MFKRYFMFFIVLLIPILFAFGVTYKVGTEASFPPFEYVENGQYVGFDIDLIKEIGKLKGFDVEVIIAAGMTITEDRQKVVDFTIPYYSGDQSILVRKDSDFDITVLFGNHKIGVQTGTTGDLWVTEHLSDKNIIPKKNITRYDTFNFAVRDLVNKNIDAIVLDNPVAERFTKTDPVKIVGIIKTEESYGMAVKKGNKELLNLLNSGIQELQKNGKLDELIEKYFK